MYVCVCFAFVCMVFFGGVNTICTLAKQALSSKHTCEYVCMCTCVRVCVCVVGSPWSCSAISFVSRINMTFEMFAVGGWYQHAMISPVFVDACVCVYLSVAWTLPPVVICGGDSRTLSMGFGRYFRWKGFVQFEICTNTLYVNVNSEQRIAIMEIRLRYFRLSKPNKDLFGGFFLC